MSTIQYDVYLAGPLFNEEDNKELDVIESICEQLELNYFSPRKHSQADFASAKTLEDRDKVATKILEDNHTAIQQSAFVLANTRDFDSGTMYELGYAGALGIPFITYSFKGYGLNIMISQMSIYHVTTIDFNQQNELVEILKKIKDKVSEFTGIRNLNDVEDRYEEIRVLRNKTHKLKDIELI